MSVAVRHVLVTRCLGCGRRIHAPSEESFLAQKHRHMRNCVALKLHGQLPALDALPPKVAKELARPFPRRTFRERLAALWRAIRAKVFG